MAIIEQTNDKCRRSYWRSIMSLMRLLPALTFMLISCTNSIFAQCQYELEAVEPPIPESVFLRHADDSGATCGLSEIAGSSVAYWQFDDLFSILETPPGLADAIAYGVNGQAQVIGSGFLLGIQRALWWQDNTVTLIPLPPGRDNSSGEAINAHGIGVGTARNAATGDFTGYVYDGSGDPFFLYEVPGLESCFAYDINDDGVIVGSVYSPVAPRFTPFIYDGCNLTLLSIPKYAMQAELKQISNNRFATGEYTPTPKSSDALRLAFLWDGTSVQPLPIPDESPVQHCVTTDVNARGQITGYWIAWDYPDDGPLLWIADSVYDLTDLIIQEDTNIVRSSARILDDGTIYAAAILPNSSGEVWPIRLVPQDSPIGDLNIDCHVDEHDLALLVQNWNTQDTIFDIDNDGVVDVRDLLILISNWTAHERKHL